MARITVHAVIMFSAVAMTRIIVHAMMMFGKYIFFN